MDAPWNSTLLIATAAFLSGIFIARLTTVALQQRLQSRRLLAAGVVFTFVLLVALTYHDPPLGIGIALVATASGFLLWRRPYPKVTAELQPVPAQRAHLSDELGQSEGFYRALFEAASDAIVITQNLKIVFGNRAAATLFGLADPEQLAGRHAMDFIAPESQPLARERTARMMAGETAPLVEARFLKADGSPIEVEISSAPFLLHGRPAVLTIVREVTVRKRMEAALRQSEARFRSLTELSSDWYWEQDEQFRTTFVSERYSAANGLRMDPNLGKTRFEIRTVWESEEQKRQHQAALEAHRPFNDLRVSRYDEDGRLRHLSISGRPAFDADGRFIGYHGVGRDVTEQERMQRALRDSEARFRSLTELSSDWYWEQDAEFRFTDRCSDGLAKSGFDRRKLIGRRRDELSYYSLMKDEDWAPLIEATSRREPFRDVLMPLLNDQGELRYMMISGAPFYHDAQFAGYRGVGVDVTERERQREQLQIFRAAMETSPEAIFITDMQQMRYVDVNETTCRMLGYTREELLRMGPQDNNPNVSKEYIRSRYEEARRQGSDHYMIDSDNRFLQRKDGTVFPQEIHRRYLRIGNRDLIVSVVRDISAEQAATTALRLRNRALESSVNAVMITRAGGDLEIEYVNPAFTQLTGYSADEAIGRNPRFLHGEDRKQPDLQRLRQALNDGEECTVLLRNYSKAGELFWNDLRVAPVREGDRVSHFVGVLNDITVAKRYQDELAHQATHDTLTGVPNRNLLDDRLRQSIAAARRRRQEFAVVFIDLDHFKRINDARGHKAGDAVLVEVARRLQGCVRGVDTLARYAGDEFVAVLNESAGEDAVAEALRRLRAAVSQPLHVDGEEITMTCSVGAALYPRDGLDAETLLRNADAAMYQVKGEGRDGVRFFRGD